MATENKKYWSWEILALSGEQQSHREEKKQGAWYQLAAEACFWDGKNQVRGGSDGKPVTALI